MVPLRLTLQGFLSYRDETSFNFTGTSLWMLSGANGAGKSSVFDAITYALFAYHRAGGGGQGGEQNAKDLLNRHSDRMRVAFEFAAGGEEYRAERTLAKARRSGAASTVSRVLSRRVGTSWEAVAETTTDDGFKSAIARILGMTAETFTSSVLLRQGKTDALLDAKPNDRFKLLSEVVDLSAYEALHKRAENRQQFFASTVAIKDSDLQRVRAVSREEIESARTASRNAGETAAAAKERKEHLIKLSVLAVHWERLKSEERKLDTERNFDEALLAESISIRLDAERFSLLSNVVPRLSEWAEAQTQFASAVSESDSCRGIFCELYDQHAPTFQLPPWADFAGNLLMATQAFDASLAGDIGHRRSAKDALPWLRQYVQARLDAQVAMDTLTSTTPEQSLPEWETFAQSIIQSHTAMLATESTCGYGWSDAKKDIKACKERLKRFLEAGDDAVCRYCEQPLNQARRITQLAELHLELESANTSEITSKSAYDEAVENRTASDAAIASARQEYGRQLSLHQKRAEERLTASIKLNTAIGNAETALSNVSTDHATQITPPSSHGGDSSQIVTEESWIKSVYPSVDDLTEIARIATGLPVVEGIREYLRQLVTSLQNAAIVIDERKKALANAERHVPDDWRSEIKNLESLTAECLRLQNAPQRVIQLQRAEQGKADRNIRLARVAEEVAAIPEDARRPANEINTELESATDTEGEALAAMRTSEAKAQALQLDADRYAELTKARDEAQLNESVYKSLAGLLGPKNLQRHLLRNAEDAIVNGANGWLQQFSHGAMRLEPRPAGQGARNMDTALDLMCINLDTAGGDALPLACLSGSQRFRVAVSLALGIGQFASREHARIRSVIIDEGFGSLDPIGQGEMVDALKEVANSLERVIVVSHLETFSDGFDNRFDIRLHEGRSRVNRIVGGVGDIGEDNLVAASGLTLQRCVT